MFKNKALKNTQLFVLSVALCLPFASSATDNVVLVGNIQNEKSLSLNRQQIRNLFMGGNSSHNIQAVALEADHPTRVIFNTKVIGLTEARIQSYWAQMKFSGRKKPPTSFSSELELIEYIKNTPNTVGYVSSNIELPVGIDVIFKTNN